ncbi:MAG TPA: caspase family protein, partial [Candidatus Polarisedimenticolia bacterium]|nr:caspase family protein [Candidatus Polarisedimenticolia bacterium]
MAVACIGTVEAGRKEKKEAREKELQEALKAAPDSLTLDDLAIVDCMLPGEVRKMGSKFTYMTAPRPIRTTSEQCGIRGGEQVMYDPADFDARLKFWLAAAEKGDHDAEYTVARMYQEGWGTAIDYEEAATWYRKSAEAGNQAAMIKLGMMYERGLGNLTFDPRIAMEWYRKASGVSGSIVLDSERQEMEERAQRLEAQVAELTEQLTAASAEVEAARSKGAVSEEQVRGLQRKVDNLKSDLGVKSREIARLKEEKIAAANVPPDVNLAPPRIEVVSGYRATTGSYLGRVEAQAGMQTLTVDGVAKTWNQDGFFDFEIGAGNRSRLEAVDRRGRKTTLAYEVRIAADGTTVEVPPTKLPEVPLGRFYALLIGNSRYQKLAPLQTPARDVEAIASELQSRYGFSTKTLFDATETQIKLAIRDLAAKVTDKDNVLIYFAGHGALKGERGYWLPVDATESSDTNWVSSQQITERAETELKARRVLIVADSCYSGTMTRSSLPRLEGASEKDQKRWMQQIAGRR